MRPVESVAPPRALPQPPSLTTYRPRWRPSALPPETPAWPPQCLSPYMGPWFLQDLAWPPAPPEISPSSPHLPLPSPLGSAALDASSAKVLSQVLFPKLLLPEQVSPLWKQGWGSLGLPSTRQPRGSDLRTGPALALLEECQRETSPFPATAHMEDQGSGLQARNAAPTPGLAPGARFQSHPHGWPQILRPCLRQEGSKSHDLRGGRGPAIAEMEASLV